MSYIPYIETKSKLIFRLERNSIVSMVYIINDAYYYFKKHPEKLQETLDNIYSKMVGRIS